MAPKSLILMTITLLAAVLLAGCSGPLTLNYSPTTVAEPIQAQAPVATILVTDIIDTRNIKPLTKIGNISTTVADINSKELILSKEPALTLREAFISELRASGYTVVSSSKGDLSKVGYVLSGELRNFTLDIASRDTISIELYMELKENATGRLAWSRVLHESGDRYAGVTGNTRKSLNRYLSNSIASVVRSGIVAATPALHAGLSTPLSDSSAQNPATAPTLTPKESAKGDATLSVKTDPPGAKVYIDEVYWGITPLTINFYPGIYELKLTKKRYMSETDQIGLKRGRTTVYEAELTEKRAD